MKNIQVKLFLLIKQFVKDAIYSTNFGKSAFEALNYLNSFLEVLMIDVEKILDFISQVSTDDFSDNS